MELIDRSTLGREIPLKVCLPCPMGEDFECKDCPLDKAMEMIEAAPTIESVPVRHAKWKFTGANRVDCSACGHSICFAFVLSEGSLQGYSYCPNCGARMDGGRKT